MRIISGSARGIPILCPKRVARPTSDRVREALFSILGERTMGARVLDLFAGSGALALEALSRGADSAVIVEANRVACETIRANVEKTKLQSARIHQGRVESFLRHAAAGGSARYDLVFADPPYHRAAKDEDYVNMLVIEEGLALSGILSGSGLVVLETEAGRQPVESAFFETVDFRQYGGTALHFLVPKIGS